MVKCKKGFKQKNGRCVKIKRSSKTFKKLKPRRNTGIIFIVIGIIAMFVRVPKTDCFFLNILCQARNIATTNVIFFLGLASIVFGVFLFTRKK